MSEREDEGNDEMNKGKKRRGNRCKKYKKMNIKKKQEEKRKGK